MLIRSSPLLLEKRRVPIGPVRANRDHPLFPYLRGLWLWSPNAFGIDLMGATGALTYGASTALRTSLEGPQLYTGDANTAGASTTFASGHPLYITSGHGLSTYVRRMWDGALPDSFVTIFGVSYSGTADPFAVNVIAQTSFTNYGFYWNTGGTFRQQNVGTPVANSPRSLVLAHTFGSRVEGFDQGAAVFADTTNVAAPNYGTSPILGFGRDGVNTRHSRSYIGTTAIFARGLNANDAMLLEAEPYSLVEQDRPWVAVSSAPPPPPPPPPPAPEIRVTGNGNTISDGDATPSATDHTDFGSTVQGGGTVTRTFTVNNDGTADLTTSGLVVPTGYTVTEGLSATIAASASDTFSVRLDDSVVGVKSGDISFTTNDSDEGTFNFAITGEVTAAPPPPPPPASTSTSRRDVVRGSAFGVIVR